MGALNFDPDEVLASIRKSRATPAKVANPAKQVGDFSNFSSFSRLPSAKSENDTSLEDAERPEDAFEERAAIVEFDGSAPREWAEGFARLDLATPPAGFTTARWRQLIDDGGHFLDRWASEAAALGWTATDVFGLHPNAPATRFDGMGLVVLIGGGEVIAVSADRATIRGQSGNSLTYYLRRPRPDAVAAWELAPNAPRREAR